MVHDASLLNTQHYKVRIKGKVVAIKKGALRSASTVVANFTYNFLALKLTFSEKTECGSTRLDGCFFLACQHLLGNLTSKSVFAFIANNYMVSSNYFYLLIILCLHTVI